MSLLKLKILIVDDDPSFTDLFQKYLEKDHHAVFRATNKQEAQEIVREQKERLLPIDLALVDYVIPGEDGIDISLALRESAPDLFQVALTEHDAPAITKKLITEGAFKLVMSKFDNLENMNNLLSVVLSEKKQRRSRGGYNPLEP